MKAGWQVKALGEVAEIVNGGTPKSEVAEYWDGDIDWLTPKDMGKLNGHLVGQTPRRISLAGLAKCSARQVPENSVIMSTRAPIGHLAMNTVPMAFNQGCRGMVPTSQLDAKFLFYVLGANVQALDDLGTGTTFKELSAGVLKAFPIPLPPLAEQKQIVAVLDAAFAGLSRARAHVLANLENLSHLRQSTLSRAFAGQLSTAQGNAPKTGWQTKALGEVCTKIGSGATPRGGNESDKDQGIALIRSLNVHDLEFRLKDLAFLDDDQAAALDNVSVNAGDVLLNITGASVARCCIAPAELLPARVNQHVSILRPKPEQLNTDFLAYLLVSKEMKDRLLGIGEEGGSTRQALTKAQLQDFKIPLPPIAEQREIVTTLDAAFDAFAATESHYRAKLADLDALRAALLQKAFAGELT